MSQTPVVHELAICETDQVGNGTRIWAYAHVRPGARIGEDSVLGEGVYVDRDVIVGNHCTLKNGVRLWTGMEVEDRVFIGQGASFTQSRNPRSFIPLQGEPTFVREGATIGANATILCGVTIGRFAFVGAGAVVTKDVPPHTLVTGNPATAIGKVCFCGERLLDRDKCPVKQCPIPDHTFGEAPDVN